MWARAHVRQTQKADEILEVARDELRSVVADDPWRHAREIFQRALHDCLLVALGHLRSELPMHDEPAVAVEHTCEVVERATDVDVGNVDMPVLMRPSGLHEARAFLGRGKPT